MFGGLSERKAPQSLYAGVVFADVVKVVGSLRRTAGDWWTTKDFTRNLPTKTSYCLSHPCCRTLVIEETCHFDVGRDHWARRLLVHRSLGSAELHAGTCDRPLVQFRLEEQGFFN